MFSERSNFRYLQITASPTVNKLKLLTHGVQGAHQLAIIILLGNKRKQAKHDCIRHLNVVHVNYHDIILILMNYYNDDR